ncbi:endopeptidase La [Candidatus Collierbacteria bacterium]|nr:endopeptidase La [Candidatus Collierbacteria bacterium]
MAILIKRPGSIIVHHSKQYPVVAIREGVIFPNTESILTFGRKRSVAAVNAAFKNDRKIIFVSQKNSRINDPLGIDLYLVGTLGEIQQTLQGNDDVNALVRGTKRAAISKWIETEGYLAAEISEIPDVMEDSEEMVALSRLLASEFRKAVNLGKPVEYFTMMRLMAGQDPAELSDQIASSLDISTKEKQAILEMTDVKARLIEVRKFLAHELKILEIEHNITTKTREKMDKSMRDAVLRERMKTIQKELGEDEETDTESTEMLKKLQDKKLPEFAFKRVKKEVDKLKKMHIHNPERGYLTSWIETVLDMPWIERTPNDVEIKNAKKILDTEHFGLDEVKDRILEYLAVMQLRNKKEQPQTGVTPTILCFVGPPGVGKTSIGRSIAHALNRKFVKISLGGIRDEAEIRGHRRTYVGAMPGRIIRGMKTAGTINPVFMLDELDKVGADFRGDPSAALLEALDPEQNKEFEDHYLDMPYDLSEVIFITTANVLDTIPPALRDRLEIIRFPGYTVNEKYHIAEDHLWQKSLGDNGLTAEKVNMPPVLIKDIISGYTREAGVRNLEREISKLMRKAAREMAEDVIDKVAVTKKILHKYLGPIRFTDTLSEERDDIGMATGLAWTQAGGEILFIEVSIMPGSGNLTLTGQLGDVMKESARAALSYVRSRWQDLKLEKDFYKRIDVHIHVPEGAVPKDGPSAGIAITTALVSALTGKATRKDTAMTGEVTLRGRVLEIGGLKEKAIAGHRAGIRRIIIPYQNKRNLEKIPAEVTHDIKFFPVRYMDDVLRLAMVS